MYLSYDICTYNAKKLRQGNVIDDELQGFANAATLKRRYGTSSNAFQLGLAHPDHEAGFLS